MKPMLLLTLTLVLGLGPTACVTKNDVPPGAPVVVAPPTAALAGTSQPIVYAQEPIAGRPVLVTPEQAQNILNRFNSAYPKMGSPRILIYVNRDLVDERSGIKMIARNERTTTVKGTTQSDFKADPNAGPGTTQPVNITAAGNVTLRGQNTVPSGPGQITQERDKVTAENRYRRDDPTALSLADRQTVRDVERLFGRPLRAGGATLADQTVATEMIESRPFESLRTEGDQARKDREALSRITDVVLEVLIASRSIQADEVSGIRTYSVPDIQATAIRLSDSKIIGQAASADILGRDQTAGSIATQFDVREITEATALALMEDMLTGHE